MKISERDDAPLPLDGTELVPIVIVGASDPDLKCTTQDIVDLANADYAAIGAITGSGLTMATGKMLGRSTASTGAIEEITVGSGLSLSTGTLSATAAGGDASTNTSTSVDSEVALFSGTGGKTLKRATGTGYPKLTSGVQSVQTAAQLASDLQSDLKPTECIYIACSDETTALTTGTAKITFRMAYAFTVTAVRASLTTAQTSGSIFTVDINEAGTSIISTKLTIDNTEKTSTTAATAAVISDSSLADDSEITVDIDQIGDGTAKGLKVCLIGYRT